MFQHFKFSSVFAVERQIQHQQYFALLAPLGTLNADLYTVSALHQNSGGIGKFIPDAQEGRGGGFPPPLYQCNGTSVPPSPIHQDINTPPSQSLI